MGASELVTAGALTLSVILAACDGNVDPSGAASSRGTPVANPMSALAAPDATTSTVTPTSTVTAAPPAAAPATASGVPAPGPGTESEASFVRLSPGEQASFAGWTVTFVEVTVDSRCPVDVVCVWAGEVVMALTVREPSGSAVTREVRFQGEPVEVPLQEGLALNVERVEPAPRSTSVIAAGDYVVRGRFLGTP